MSFWNELGKITKYDLVLGLDRKIANLTADALRKTPLGKKDPILAKQENDTAHGGYSGEQTKNQAVVAATIAATVASAGGYAAVAAPAARLGQAEILNSMGPPQGIAGEATENSFDNGAMNTTLNQPPAAASPLPEGLQKTLFTTGIAIAVALIK